MNAAERIGELAARAGWVILCGGRRAGVMDAAARGAAKAGGISIGLLPSSEREDAAPSLTTAIPTGIGEARNVAIARGGQAMAVCGMNAGTAAEVALALQAGRRVVLVQPDPVSVEFFRLLSSEGIRVAQSPEEAVALLAP